MKHYLSNETKFVTGIILLTVPTIIYGGLVLIDLLVSGTTGLSPNDLSLDETQSALWRAGHAHAGVWMIFSLVLQILIDGTNLNNKIEWTARMTAPLAAVLTPAGFFGLAFLPSFKWLLYLGVLSLSVSLMITGFGLLTNRH